MDDSTEPVADLGFPIAVAATGGAAVVASLTRWWLLGPFHGPVALIMAAAAGGVIGAMLTHSLRCDPPEDTRRTVFIFLAVAAPLVAMLITLLCEPEEAGGGAVLLGASFAAALLPSAFLAVRLARAAQRSRVRSLLGRSDRRAAWRTTAVWLALVSALGSVPNVLDVAVFWWSKAEKARLMQAPMIVSVAACAIVAVVAALDFRAERIVSRARDDSGDWRVDEPTHTEHALDVGIGHDTWLEHVGGRTTYRERAEERVAAIGDLGAGADLLRAATRRSAIALAVVGAAQLATMYVFSLLLVSSYQGK
ncbi:MAG: hypothetical protein HYV09_33730 [Deltaproteobacteria bacterium]|nr:hypothetical protein [Deltaproteobacteria bacterium]